MNIVFGNLTGNFTSYFTDTANADKQQFKHQISKNALYIVYLFIGKFVLSYVALFFFRTTGLRISAALRLAYIRALFAQPVKKLDEVSAGTVANTVTDASNTIQLSITDRLHLLFQSLALLIAAFAIAFRYSWALTLATSSGLLFIMVVFTFNTRPMLKAQQQLDEADAKHATVAAEVISSIRTVFSLGAEARLTEKHSKWVDEAHKRGLKLAPLLGTQFAPIFFTIYACYSLAFWFGLKLYREGHISSVGTVIIVFFSVLIVTSIMGNIVQPMMNINKAISASSAFWDIIDSAQVKSEGRRSPEVTANGDIVLTDITFAYPTRSDVQVLQKFSACFKRGKTTALVGPSGSGKSTIVGLLERWYELGDTPSTSTDSSGPSSSIDDHEAAMVTEKSSPRIFSTGSVSVDSVNINDFDLKWWRSQIGLVQQEPFIFNTSIEQNVAYGLIGTQWEHVDEAKKHELVLQACKEAFADEFICNLPKGYDTLVGEAGIKLSGGQRQRIAIARSIIKQPAILILDEATSSIDVQGERIVQEALDRLSQNRTTIMIAHRLSTIRKADHIIVLRSGVKVEEGTHEQLLALPDGLYSGLTAAQRIEEHETQPAQQDEKDEMEVAIRKMSELDRTKSHSSSMADDPEKGVENSSYQKRGFFSTVGTLIYEQRKQWPLYGVLLLAAMGCGAAYAIQSYLFAQLINVFTFTGSRLASAANFWSLMFFILALAVGACYGALGFFGGLTSINVGTVCKKDYFKNTIKMPISYFDKENNSSGSVMSRLSGDPKQMSELLGINSAFPSISVFNMIGSIIIAFYFGWKLTLVTFFAASPVILIASFIRVRYEVQFDQMDAKVFSKSSQFATEAIGAFRTVSSLTMEDSIVKKYEDLLHEQIRQSTKTASYAKLIYAFADSIELCGMALTFWYGGQLLASREYNVIQFFVIYSAIIQGSQAAGLYMSVIPNVARSTAAANRILELRSQVADLKLPDASASGKSQPGLGARIEFKDVDYRYALQSTPLFSRLNLTIEPGQFVAFVGPSGCGKTTIVSLLERFYDPIAGTITVDNENITSLNPATYRRDLSLVAQEPKLFSGTIKQNLLLGVDEPTIGEEQIVQACRDSEIHDFIISLPDSYDTELGLNTQTALSGGQKQRLCLARALLRRPKLLLLDEATSSLDSQSEHLVQSAIERLAGQRSMTVVAVAHRLATIQKADVIFVFGERDVNKRKGTRIVEMGTHQELMRKRGAYWSMIQLQTLDR